MAKNCIITGATDGIGKQSAIELAKLGYNVGIIGRNEEKGNSVINQIAVSSGNDSVEFFRADLSLINNLNDLVSSIRQKYDSVDILINNAGAYFENYIETSENLEMTFSLNHLSYFQLTMILMDMIIAESPGRVINVSSNAHFRAKLDLNNIQMKNNYKGWTAYCNSKLMNILFTYELHKRFKETGITFNALHPGFVDTNFGNNNKGLGKVILDIGKKLIAINAVQGAMTMTYLASSEEVEGISGKFFNKSKLVTSSRFSYSDKNQRKLWHYSQSVIDSL